MSLTRAHIDLAFQSFDFELADEGYSRNTKFDVYIFIDVNSIQFDVIKFNSDLIVARHCFFPQRISISSTTKKYC
jgi:hypothetical protein